MKIQTKIGNLLNVTSGHIVHGCNARGVMGSGVALGIKQKFPGAYEDYRRIFESNPTEGLPLGEAFPYSISESLVIWNAITQQSYGSGKREVSYDAIQTCFQQINDYLSDDNEYLEIDPHVPKEIHIPMIGAARGGGNWEIIREIIEQTVTYPVTLWLPDSTVTTI